jgi:AbrB family looped-hinge helix DNA binding protein
MTLDLYVCPYYDVRRVGEVRSATMVTATLTSKGQLTIPKAVRESLHLHTGDRVAFVLRGNAEVVMKPVTKSVDEVFGRLHSPTQPHRSVGEMKAAVAKRMRSRER